MSRTLLVSEKRQTLEYWITANVLAATAARSRVDTLAFTFCAVERPFSSELNKRSAIDAASQ